MNVWARVRTVLARRPWIYRCVVLAIAAVVVASVHSATAGVDAARRAWGEQRPVVVASRVLHPGDATAGALELRSLPAAMLPEGALTAMPPGAVARQHIAVDEVVVAHDLAASGGPRALLPDGWSAVAVAEPVPTGASTGDRVEVVADGVVLSDEGMVVATLDASVLVGVPAGRAPAVAAAVIEGRATLVLVP